MANEQVVAKEALEELASSLDRMTKVLADFDITPTPTRKQWVRDSAVQLAIGMMKLPRPVVGNAGNYEISPKADYPTLDAITDDAVRMAEQIWIKTRDLNAS